MSNTTAVVLRDVSFRYPAAQDHTVEALCAHFPAGFSGELGANGAGKTTLLSLVTGALQPDAGASQRPGTAVYCPQRTDDAPPRLDELLGSWDAAAYELRERLGLSDEFGGRWETLSHGERKRARIAAALWQQPAVLAIDEPTNHLDGAARDVLAGALIRYRGVGLLVSHDRELLDRLCRQCVWLEHGKAVVHPGGYSAAAEQRAHQHESATREREHAKHELTRLRREVAQRREMASRSHAQRSKRGIPIKDHDARFRKNRARVSGKDGQAGRLLRQLDGRAQQAESRLAGVGVRKTYAAGVWVPRSRAPQAILLEQDAQTMPLAGGTRTMHLPPLTVRRDDRIAITGPNGAGKSSLLREFLAALTIDKDRIVPMPQELSSADGIALLAEARALGDDRLGVLMNVVSRLGSRPERLLQSALPSPGESRKLLLALGIARTPHLIAMDEPTNHLDLPGIEALQQALADCPCALLLASHDQRFLDALVTTRWEVAIGEDGNSRVTVRH